jgi:hypothetical protein
MRTQHSPVAVKNQDPQTSSTTKNCLIRSRSHGQEHGNKQYGSWVQDKGEKQWMSINAGQLYNFGNRKITWSCNQRNKEKGRLMNLQPQHLFLKRALANFRIVSTTSCLVLVLWLFMVQSILMLQTVVSARQVPWSLKKSKKEG